MHRMHDIPWRKLLSAFRVYHAGSAGYEELVVELARSAAPSSRMYRHAY
jgi:hypothetical protein